MKKSYIIETLVIEKIVIDIVQQLLYTFVLIDTHDS